MVLKFKMQNVVVYFMLKRNNSRKGIQPQICPVCKIKATYILSSSTHNSFFSNKLIQYHCIYLGTQQKSGFLCEFTKQKSIPVFCQAQRSYHILKFLKPFAGSTCVTAQDSVVGHNNKLLLHSSRRDASMSCYSWYSIIVLWQ